MLPGRGAARCPGITNHNGADISQCCRHSGPELHRTSSIPVEPIPTHAYPISQALPLAFIPISWRRKRHGAEEDTRAGLQVCWGLEGTAPQTASSPTTCRPICQGLGIPQGPAWSGSPWSLGRVPCREHSTERKGLSWRRMPQMEALDLRVGQASCPPTLPPTPHISWPVSSQHKQCCQWGTYQGLAWASLTALSGQ